MPWIPYFLPWLPSWPESVVKLLANMKHIPSELWPWHITALSRCVINDLERQKTPSVSLMLALDDALLLNNFMDVRWVQQELTHVLHRLDDAVDERLPHGWSKLQAGSMGSLDESREAFKALCQLRARLALTVVPASSAAHVPASTEAVTEELDAGKIWEAIFCVRCPEKAISVNAERDSTSRAPAVALAASAAIAALLACDFSNTAVPTVIRADPDPVGAAKVSWVVLHVLQRAAVSVSNERSKKRDEWLVPELIARSTLKFLPKLCWGALDLVKNREERAALASYWLLSPDLQAGRAALSVDESFRKWAGQTLMTLGNKLRSPGSADSSEIFGQQESLFAEAAVRAVFPAAVLCPEALLRSLLGNAASPDGHIMVLKGVLKELPTLLQVGQESKCTATETAGRGTLDEHSPSLLIRLLRERMQNSAALYGESYHRALENCIMQLCSSSSKGTEGPENGTASCLIPPVAVLTNVMAPILEAQAWEKEYTWNDLSSSLRLSRKLMEANVTQGGCSTLTTELHDVIVTLLKTCLTTLDVSSRRLDVGTRGLDTPMAVLDEAHALLSVCCQVINPGSKAAAEVTQELVGAGMKEAPLRLGVAGVTASRESKFTVNAIDSLCTVWDRVDVLCEIFSTWIITGSGTCEEIAKVCRSLPLQQLREAIVVTVAVLLPCCSSSEGENLIRCVSELVRRSALPSASASEASIHAAAIEVLCRSLYALALVPGLIPLPGVDDEADSLLIGIERENHPSQRRHLAVNRHSQHLSRFCQSAVEQASKSERPSLAARAFLEVCRCAAAIHPFYDPEPLRVCLLHLAHTLSGVRSEVGAEPKGRDRIIIKAALSLKTDYSGALIAALNFLEDSA